MNRKAANPDAAALGGVPLRDVLRRSGVEERRRSRRSARRSLARGSLGWIGHGVVQVLLWLVVAAVLAAFGLYVWPFT